MAGKIEIKIAYIGGGSRYWAHELMSDLALCPHLTGHLALYDIDHPAAEHNVNVAGDIFNRPEAQTTFKVTAPKSPATALRGADFVVCSIEPGPTEMRYADLEIPRRYGIIQPVGDSTGPGGIMRAMRSVPTKMRYAHLIMKHCPNAWVINYTNPMTLCTAGFYAAEPDIKAFGCCHEVFGTQSSLSALVAETFKIERPARHEIILDVSGVNHFSLATAASWNGQDLWPLLHKQIAKKGFFRSRKARALKRIRNGEVFGSDKLVSRDLLRCFDVLGSAGDRHLVEFVPWYLDSEETLHRWGVVCTPYAWRIQKASRKRGAARYGQATLNQSGEEGVAQILALLGVQTLTTNVNVPNEGQMPQIRFGHVVEAYAQFSRDSIRPIVAGPLPDGALGLVERVVQVQDLTLMAIVERSHELAFQAMLSDPLVSISTDRAWKMYSEMVDYTREMLPGWK